MKNNLNIAIIGGGIGGLTTAIACRQKGFNPIVYEKAPEIRPIGAGIVLSINAMKALDQLNLTDQLIAHGQPVSTLSLQTQHGKSISKTNFSSLAKQYNMPSIGISRSALQDILVQALPPSSIRCGHELESVTLTNTNARITFSNNHTIEADIVIGADGLQSTLRHHLFPAIHRRFSGQTSWRGLVTNAKPLDSFFETWGPGKRFGAVQVGQNQVYWYAGGNEKKDTLISKNDTSKSQLLEMFSDWHTPINEIISQTDPTSICHNHIYDLPPTKHWFKDTVVLLGDAIHATTPNLGQGAGMAIESALTLAQSIATQDTLLEAFTDYQNKRQKRTKWVTQQSWKFGKLAQLKSPVHCHLRNTLMSAMSNILPEKILNSPLIKLIEHPIVF